MTLVCVQITCMKRVGSDTIVTGSDDGNLRVWSLARNQVRALDCAIRHIGQDVVLLACFIGHQLPAPLPSYVRF
jgi:WD40 repeat protein